MASILSKMTRLIRSNNRHPNIKILKLCHQKFSMAVIWTSFHRSSRSLERVPIGYCWLTRSQRALNLKSNNLPSPSRDEHLFKQIKSLRALLFSCLFFRARLSCPGRGPAKRSIKTWGLVFSWCWIKILLARMFESKVLDESLTYTFSWLVFLMIIEANSYILSKVSSLISNVSSTSFFLII